MMNYYVRIPVFVMAFADSVYLTLRIVWRTSTPSLLEAFHGISQLFIHKLAG